MQNIICYVAANEPLGIVKDYANAKSQPPPTMVLGAACQLRMRLFANSEGLDSYPISAFSAITSWQWQMDTDFTAATTRKIEADNSDITVGSVTVEINDEEYTYTEISIPISNMLTEELVALMNGKETASIAGELCGFDGTGALVFILQVKGFTVRGRISDTGTPTEMPVEYLTEAQVRALVNSGFEVVFAETASTTPADWHSTQTAADRYMKFRLADDSSSAWSDIVALVAGTDGVTPHIDPTSRHWIIGTADTGIIAEGQDGDTLEIDPETLHWIINGVDTGVSAQGIIVQIQYSSDAQNWHATFASGDKFIRFSADEGVSWSAAMKFIGDNAPQVMIQYSADGASWHQIVSTDDYFFRFSVDNGTTWGGGSQFRAYAVRYQYGETASATFHDTFVAGSDKFVKFSSDNGATWTNAFKFIGNDGRSFVPAATGTYANMSTYDTESQGFSYLVTSGTNEGKIYFKTSDTSGEWSDGLKFTPSGLSLQYSLDGSSWHTTATVDDKYIRFSTDDGTTWSAACLFKGHSTYTYTAYASDNSGNDFSLTPSSDLDFWNWIYSDAPIAAENLTLQTFNTLGDGWRRCQGDPGITYDWLSGASIPASSTGKNGDWYINTATGDVYQKVAGAWVLKMNITGPVGAGATPKGAWVAVTSYSKNDMVTYQGSTYIAARDNSNVEPGTSSDDWVQYVSKGDTGPAPTIGSNGNWYINGVDSGLPSRGPNGITPHIGENGNWYIGSTDTGVIAEISGSYIEFSAVDASGNYTLAGTTTMPYAVLTNAGNLYPLEKGSVAVNTSLNTVSVNVAPYLAYDGAASFSGTWRLYFAAGSAKVDFNGLPWVALTSSSAVTIPTGGNAYTLTIEQNTTITFPTPGNSSCYFWLYISTGATEYSVNLPVIDWGEGPIPAWNSTNSLFRMSFLWDVPTQKWLGNQFWPKETLT